MKSRSCPGATVQTQEKASAITPFAQLPGITEREFTAQVLQLAKVYAWVSAHFRPARTTRGWKTAVQGDGAGFPDLLLIHPATGRIIVAELKVGNNRCSSAQKLWLKAFAAAGVQAFIWYPKDFELIKAVLMEAGQ